MYNFPKFRIAVGVVLLCAVVAGCTQEKGPTDGAVGENASKPQDSESLSGEYLFAYEFNTLDEFEKLTEQLAVVEVTKVSPADKVSRSFDQETRLRLVTVKVLRPIKGLTAGQTLTYSDGLYVRMRQDGSDTWSTEALELITDGVELHAGDRAVVGLRDADLLAPGVFPVSSGRLATTGRATSGHQGHAAFAAVEGLTEDEVVARLETLASQP